MADEVDEMADIRAELDTNAAAAEVAAVVAAADKDKADKGEKPATEVVAEAIAADDKVEAQADAAKDEAVVEEIEAEADDKDEKKVVVDDKAANRDKSKRFLMREEINRLKAVERDGKAEIARLAAELAVKNVTEVAPELDADGKPKPKIKTEAQIREEVRAEERQKTTEAEREATAKAFNDACNAAFDKGAEVYGEEDFKDATDTLNLLGMGARHVEAALATDAPERVLFLLAEDTEKAKRIFALPPLKMAAEMAKIASSRARAPAKAAALPAPVTPVGGKGAETDGAIFDNNASDAVVDKFVNGALERIQGKWN